MCAVEKAGRLRSTTKKIYHKDVFHSLTFQNEWTRWGVPERLLPQERPSSSGEPIGDDTNFFPSHLLDLEDFKIGHFNLPYSIKCNLQFLPTSVQGFITLPQMTFHDDDFNSDDFGNDYFSKVDDMIMVLVWSLWGLWGLWGLWIVDIPSVSILSHNWIPGNAHIRIMARLNISLFGWFSQVFSIFQ